MFKVCLKSRVYLTFAEDVAQCTNCIMCRRESRGRLQLATGERKGERERERNKRDKEKEMERDMERQRVRMQLLMGRSERV